MTQAMTKADGGAVPAQAQPELPQWLMTKQWAESAYRSGLFKSVNNMHQAVVKITMGLELGISPMRAMQSIYIVSGNITMNGTLIGALIKRSGKYNYAVQQLDDGQCIINFFERTDTGEWKPSGASKFTMQDAQRAGLAEKDNWRMYPRNMLFNRAISNGARWYTPDVFSGAIYTPDEMDLRVDAKGDVIEGDIKVPDRDSWQREAAALLYEKVSPEVVEKIQRAGKDADVTYEQFTLFLYDVAGDHVIDIPDNPRMPREAPKPPQQAEQKPEEPNEEPSLPEEPLLAEDPDA
jgi:hypothetical protein